MHDHIADLLDHPKVLETRHHLHHSISKHEHIMRVARFSVRLARLARANERVVARAAVIHDIDSRFGTLANHGDVAARWAAEALGEDAAICEAIRSHMYPFGPPPTSREGWVLSMADKAASLADLADYVGGLLTGRSQQRRLALRLSDPFYGQRQRPTPRQRVLRAALRARRRSR